MTGIDAVQRWGEKPTLEQLRALPPWLLTVLQTIAPVLGPMQDRLDALEKALVAQGVAPPGVAVVDPVVTAYVKDYCWQLEQTVARLEKEALSYRGVFAEGTKYLRGHLVSHKGSLWMCTGVSTERPNAPGAEWRLVVKQGSVPK